VTDIVESVNGNHNYIYQNLKVVSDKEKVSCDTLDNTTGFQEGDPEYSEAVKLQISWEEHYKMNTQVEPCSQ
jgi:hypothetical protein